MKILSIETSCDETAISILEAAGGLTAPVFKVLSEVTVTQLDLHKEFGGVVPMLAKREHQKALVPILIEALERGGIARQKRDSAAPAPDFSLIKNILDREQELFTTIENRQKDLELIPDIDAIAVTHGPGLVPALWVGVNFAKALSILWGKPIVPVNHMEGHLLSGLLESPIAFPALALLVSGGHTELVLAKNWCEYEILGHTRDDAVGEAFDKVARILGLPYPGGPAISKLALEWNENIHGALGIVLPRPMIHSHDFDFSFAGLKTSVLYLTKKIGELSNDHKIAIAHEFQNAAIEVLISKTKRAIEMHNPKTLVIGGGVSANKHLREKMSEMISRDFSETSLTIPSLKMSTDNATMIALAGYIRFEKFGAKAAEEIIAEGNLSL